MVFVTIMYQYEDGIEQDLNITEKYAYQYYTAQWDMLYHGPYQRSINQSPSISSSESLCSFSSSSSSSSLMGFFGCGTIGSSLGRFGLFHCSFLLSCFVRSRSASHSHTAS